MMYFVIKRWRDCKAMLDLGYDACGVLAITDHPEIRSPLMKIDGGWRMPLKNTNAGYNFFYGGNFYWASCRYIKRLPFPGFLDVNNRYMAEAWIGMAKNSRIAECDNDFDLVSPLDPSVQWYVYAWIIRISEKPFTKTYVKIQSLCFLSALYPVDL